MKKILVPVDHSEVSINALKYALNLFSTEEIEIVHVSSGILDLKEPLNLSSGVTKEDTLISSLKSAILSQLKLNEWPDGLKINILVGEPVYEIKTYVDQHQIDIVVLGTRDKYDIFDRWIGTVSLGLIKTLRVPVYIIPRYSTFRPYKKVVVASDHDFQNSALIQRVKKWNMSYQAYIQFLHIQTKKDDAFNEESQKIVHELFEKDDPPFGFEVSTLKAQNISTSLLSSAYNFQADLLIAITHQQSFIQSLLVQSLSKELILKSSIPVLFFHPK